MQIPWHFPWLFPILIFFPDLQQNSLTFAKSGISLTFPWPLDTLLVHSELAMSSPWSQMISATPFFSHGMYLPIMHPRRCIICVVFSYPDSTITLHACTSPHRQPGHLPFDRSPAPAGWSAPVHTVVVKTGAYYHWLLQIGRKYNGFCLPEIWNISLPSIYHKSRLQRRLMLIKRPQLSTSQASYHPCRK